MKYCYDCKHYDRPTVDCLRLTHLEKDLVTGITTRKGDFLYPQLERNGKILYRLYMWIFKRSPICGKEARFFEPRTDKKE